MDVVQITTALGIIQSSLSGFRGYPSTPAGENRFAQELAAVSVSVNHAIAIAESFDQFFPTIKEIRDVASSSRPKFKRVVDPTEEWQRQYGKPRQFDVYPADHAAMHWQAIRDSLYYNSERGRSELRKKYGARDAAREEGFWLSALQFNMKEHAESVEFVKQQIIEMGWDAIMALTASPTVPPYKDPVKALRRSKLPTMHQVAQSVPTLDHRKTTAEVDEEMAAADSDGWDDPDR